MNIIAKFSKSRGAYKPVAQDKDENEVEVEVEAGERRREPPRNYALIIALLLFISIALGTAISESKESWASSCANPGNRQEWRSLDKSQQDNYLDAVQCLMDKPSVLHPGTYRYDDFAYAHIQEGATFHYNAAFLAWYRYFIHLYEKALKDECGYEGSLPYWDWTLDSEDLSASPIWDAFGGDGDAKGDIIVDSGRCVLDGPFSSRTRHWASKEVDHEFQTIANPHCLSRGFVGGESQGTLENLVSQTSIDGVLRARNFNVFLKLLEASAYDAIPQFINGDFHDLSAPNDPVFFLHLAQLDRIWWKWQQADPKHRYNDFTGSNEDFSQNKTHTSSLEDVLYAGDLGHDAQVKEIMRADTALLCYKY